MLLKRRPVFETRPGGGKVESVVFPKPWLEFFFLFFFFRKRPLENNLAEDVGQ